MSKNTDISWMDKPRVANWISAGNFVAVVVLGIAMFCLAGKQSGLDRRIATLTVQPRLTLTRPPHIRGAQTVSDLKPLAEHIRQYPHPDSTTPTLKIPGEIHLTTWLFLRNTGNALARVVACAQSDQVSWKPMLRDKLLEARTGDTTIQVEAFEKPIELMPGDSTRLTFESKIQFVSNDTIALHYMVLYRNDLEDLYDTYIWSRYLLKPPEFGALVSGEGDSARIMFRPPRPQLASDVVVAIDQPIPSFWIYDPPDAERIQKVFRNRLDQGNPAR